MKDCSIILIIDNKCTIERKMFGEEEVERKKKKQESTTKLAR